MEALTSPLGLLDVEAKVLLLYMIDVLVDGSVRCRHCCCWAGRQLRTLPRSASSSSAALSRSERRDLFHLQLLTIQTDD